MATPLFIEIGLHYHCRADEFDPHRMNAPAVKDALAAFVSHGMLKKLVPRRMGALYAGAKNSTGVQWWSRNLGDLQPTHWMPLPSAPHTGSGL